MTTNKKNYSQNQLKVYDAGGDTSKRWFVYYYEAGKRKRVNGKINSSSIAADRYQAIKELKTTLLNPESQRKRVIQLLHEYVAHKKTTLRRKTWMDYSSKLKAYEDFYSGGSVTIREADAFSDYLVEVKGLHLTTHNDYIRFLRGAFAWLVKRGRYDHNPFVDCEYKKVVSTSAFYFQPQQIQELREVLKEQDPTLWLFVQFIYYCFTRPGELQFMKVSDILWEDRLLLLRPEISKNKKQQYVRIPDAFYPTCLISVGLLEFVSDSIVMSVKRKFLFVQ